MELTNKQWELIEPMFPERELRPSGKGRPPRHPREVLCGVLWVLKTGAQWNELPYRYPPYQTCHRRFQQWVNDGLFERILHTLAHDLRDRGGLDVKECFIDGTFASAKKGALALGRPNAERAQRSWVSSTATVFLSPYPREVLRRMS
jgi:transposase